MAAITIHLSPLRVLICTIEHTNLEYRQTLICTDLGSLIWNFDYGYSTVWKFGNFPGSLILREIHLGWFQKVKNSRLNNFFGFEFWLWEKKFKLNNVKNSKKFKIQNCSSSQNGRFWVVKLTKIDFTLNLSAKKILKCPHSEFPIRLPRTVFVTENDWKIWV